MLLGCLSPAGSEQDRSSERRALLDRLIEVSGKAFADVEFLIHEASSSFNAQAFCIGRQKVVALFGGLAFNRRMHRNGLLFAILHEVGHHLAPGPRMTVTSDICCDCAADRWAIGGGKGVILSHGLTLDIECAMSEIEAAISELGGASTLRADRLCFDWARRKAKLTSPVSDQLAQCEYRMIFMNEGGKNGISDTERR